MGLYFPLLAAERAFTGVTRSGRLGCGRYSHRESGFFPDFAVIFCSYTAEFPLSNATAWNHTELLPPPGAENMWQLYIKTARTGSPRA
jgi:hypothetical protein